MISMPVYTCVVVLPHYVVNKDEYISTVGELLAQQCRWRIDCRIYLYTVYENIRYLC